MKYTEKYTVTSHDVDVNNNIKPSVLIRYMQETANHQMRDRKPSYLDFFREGKSFIITRITVEIYDQIHQYEDIQVSTWRCPAKGATFPRAYDIRRDDDLVAVAYSEWAVPDRNTGKLSRVDEIDISSYEADDDPVLAIPKRFRFPKDADMVDMGTQTVFYDLVDMNLHMNNANYADLLWRYIPDIKDKKVTSINLRFMKEGPMGEDIDIKMLRGCEELAGDDRAEEVYGFRTFVPAGINTEALIGVKKI